MAATPSLVTRARAALPSPAAWFARVQDGVQGIRRALVGTEITIADPRLAQLRSIFPQYNPDTLVGRKGLQIYDEMRLDEQVKACMALKKAAVLGPGWDIEPASDDGPDVELAETLTEDLQHLPGTLRGKLWQVLSALEFGYSVSERLWDIRDRRVVLSNLKTRKPHDFEFHTDEHGNVEKIVQTHAAKPIDVPPERVWHFVHQPEWDNPYGHSDLREAYRSYFHKTHWIQWLSIWGEKLAIPALVGKHPPTATQQSIDGTLELLTKLQASTAFTVPQEWDLNLLESTRDPRGTFVAVLDLFNMLIARATLLPDKAGLSGGEVKGGSYALAAAQLGVWFTVIDFLREQLANAVRQEILAPMVAFERPGAEVPTFRLQPLCEEDKQAIGKLWIEAITGGAVRSTPADEQHFRQLVDFPELTEEELAERQEEAEAERERRMNPPEPMAPPGSNGRSDTGDGEEGDRGAPPTRRQMTGVLPMPGTAVAEKAQAAVPTTFWRPLRAVERRADMAAQRDALEAATSGVTIVLAEAMIAVVDDIRKKARKLIGPKAAASGIRTLSVSSRILGAAHRDLEDAFTGAYTRASREAVRELRRARKDMTVDPETFAAGLFGTRAKAFFKNKAFFVTDVTVDEILKRAKQKLFSALKQDKTDRQIMFELDEVLTPYLPEVDAAGKIVNVPARLEVIARTNIAEAVNEGRWAVFTDPELEGFVEAVQYSAILDDRVRENHAAWDGVTLPVDHEVWFGPPDRRPPNAWNCRCQLLPIVADDDEPLTDPDQIPDVEVVDEGFK